MSQLSTVRSRIADDLDRTDLNTQIDKAINRAIEHYRKERFYFNETSSTFVTVANQESYGIADSIPSTITEVDRLEITISSNNKPDLFRRTIDYIRDRNGYVVTGQPDDYAWFQSKFYLSPIPNAVYTMTVYFGKTYAAMTADSDTNDFTAYAEDLIEARARWWIYKRTIKDKEEADFAKEDELEALMSLREQTRMLISTGKITPSTF